jgi:beta-mannosidase
LNDNWPVASWSSIEYGGKWKPLHYMAKRFFSPALVAVFQKNDVLQICAMNDGVADLEFDVTLTIYDLCGSELRRIYLPFHNVVAGSSVKLEELGVDDFDFELNEVFMMIEAQAVGDGKSFAISNTHFFVPYKKCDLPQSEVGIQVEEDENGLFLELSADKPAFLAVCETPGVKGMFDDNCVTLLPGVPKRLRFFPKQPVTRQELAAVAKITHLAATLRI